MKTVGNKVIVKKIPESEKTEGGIIIPNKAVRMTTKGEVVCAPFRYSENGVLIDNPFGRGDKITYYTKAAIPLDEPDLFCVEMSNVLYME